MSSKFLRLLIVLIASISIVSCQSKDSSIQTGKELPKQEAGQTSTDDSTNKPPEADTGGKVPVTDGPGAEVPAEPKITIKEDTFNHPIHQVKPVVVMISIDGFRADYMRKYAPPTLMAWARDGVLADGLIPSFPTLTFPNHVTLVTGLRPGKHGIVGNTFYDKERKAYYSISDGASTDDGSWYRGEPLWTVAEKSGMLSATFYWVGSEAGIGGEHPTYMAHYDGKVTNDKRIKTVIDWLHLPYHRRPHFISLYFSDVDSAGHKYGPDAIETKKSVLEIDTQLSVLKKAISQLDYQVQVIIVSDHGMKNIEHTVDISSAETLRTFETSGRGALASFYSDDQAAIEKAMEELKQIKGPFKAYRGSELPKEWALIDKNRRGDIVVVGEPGAYVGFGFSPAGIGSSNKATHGWDAKNTKELNGLFIASGSMFKKGHKIDAFDNVHIYPMVLNILGLQASEPHDGDLKVLKPILARKRPN